MFGIVSTGPSSIADRHDLRSQAARRGDQQDLGRRPEARRDHRRRPTAQQGPPEVRYRAHVAFSTAYDVLKKLEQVHNRRKAFIYVSNGYDFDPFSKSRAKEANERYSDDDGRQQQLRRSATRRHRRRRPTRSQQRHRHQSVLEGRATSSPRRISRAELSELTREANRANTTIYTIDPRGLVGGPDLDETKLDMHGLAGSHPRDAEQPARDRRADRRLRRRQPERLRQGAQADRRRDERLLRARVTTRATRIRSRSAAIIEITVKKAGQVRPEIQDVVHAEAAARGQVLRQVPTSHPNVRLERAAARRPFCIPVTSLLLYFLRHISRHLIRLTSHVENSSMRLRTKAVWSLAAAFCFCAARARRRPRRRRSRPATSRAVVTDAQGGVLPGATVTATHTDTGTSYEAVTGGRRPLSAS